MGLEPKFDRPSERSGVGEVKVVDAEECAVVVFSRTSDRVSDLRINSAVVRDGEEVSSHEPDSELLNRIRRSEEIRQLGLVEGVTDRELA